jgi:hypothetical protein
LKKETQGKRGKVGIRRAGRGKGQRDLERTKAKIKAGKHEIKRIMYKTKSEGE